MSGRRFDREACQLAVAAMVKLVAGVLGVGDEANQEGTEEDGKRNTSRDKVKEVAPYFLKETTKDSLTLSTFYLSRNIVPSGTRSHYHQKWISSRTRSCSFQ